MEEYAAGNQNWMLTQGSNSQIYIANNEGVYHLMANDGSYIQQIQLFDRWLTLMIFYTRKLHGFWVLDQTTKWGTHLPILSRRTQR